MKNIIPKLIKLFKKGYCTPQIGRIAKTINEPASTIHYNIKKLESEGVIKAYKSVFDYKKIDEGFCAYILIDLAVDEYLNPDLAIDLAKYEEIESIDLISGDWDMILKVRTKDVDEYYDFVGIFAREGILKTKTMISLKQIKTEFVLL
jgi:DNA-binding Lrp family transcriptional regulator